MTVKSHAFSIGHSNVGDRHIVAATKKNKTAKTTRLGRTLRIFDEKFGPPNALV